MSPRWNSRMVHSRERFLEMENFLHWFLTMDSWQASVSSTSSYAGADDCCFYSGRRKDRPLVRLTLHIFIYRGAYHTNSSEVIRDIDALRKHGHASLAFFYCDFREDQKKELRGLLSSLLVQLCHQSDTYCDVLSDFYSEYGSGSQHASDDALVGCLKDLLKLPGQTPVYLVVDGLDECPITADMPTPREEVLNFIDDLVKLELPNLRICLTSRPEIDVKAVLSPLTSSSISLHREKGQIQDIVNYIRSVVNTNKGMRR